MRSGKQLIDHLEARRGVVLDHGLWLREDRDMWKKTVASAGGIWRLVYLPSSKTSCCGASPSATSARTPTH
ncbi:MAG: hypothetical protein ACRDUV_19210 [Pseudonocardiaceae bacterium]